jgi:hypothetical protein
MDIFIREVIENEFNPDNMNKEDWVLPERVKKTSYSHPKEVEGGPLF